MRLLILLVPLLLGAATDTRRSGFEDLSPSTQAMQRDDAQNPAMLWAAQGEAAWKAQCMSCHGDATRSMRGVAARYPNAEGNLAQRIRRCQKTPDAFESQALLALETYVGLQSRGLPIAPPAGRPMDALRTDGERLFKLRMGQLDLSCAQCHDERAGGRLAGSPIPQAHPTGYPIYRLEWQGVGSLQRRLRNCMTGIRAQPFEFGTHELVALEAYLAKRAEGMRVETPGVRP